jgi:phosphoglucomutase
MLLPLSSFVGPSDLILTSCQTDHIILSHELDDVLQGRWMPSSALGVDVVREIWRHVVDIPDGWKWQDCVELVLSYASA